VTMLEAVDERIEIQMTHEVAKAQWINIVDIPQYTFTKAATRTAEIILNCARNNDQNVDLSNVAVDDLFRGVSFTADEYLHMNHKNKFYSSALAKSIRAH